EPEQSPDHTAVSPAGGRKLATRRSVRNLHEGNGCNPLDFARGAEHCPRRAAGRPGLSAARDGAVAQLGERLVRNEEVRGSIPLSSTTVSAPPIHNHFMVALPVNCWRA